MSQDDDTEKRNKTIQIVVSVSLGVLVLLIIAARFYFAKPAAYGSSHGYYDEPKIQTYRFN